LLFLNSDGTVKASQKISAAEGGFTGTLDDGDHFGCSTSPLGDLDGNGACDIAVGTTNDDDGGYDRGAAWILFLNSDGTVKASQKISATEGGFTGTLDDGDHFGCSIASLGDLDDDGVCDIAAGATDDDDGNLDCGAAWILFLEAPICSICPSNIVFEDSICLQDFRDTSLTITNIGSGELEGAVSESCDHCTVVSGEGPYVLSAGQSHTVIVRFEPASTGFLDCAIEVGQGLCCDVMCSAYGHTPMCEAGPVEIIFPGPVGPGSSVDTSFSISNTGCGTLSGSISESCDEFTVSPSSYSLGSGQSATFTVTYSPMDEGEDSCTIFTHEGCDDVTCYGNSSRSGVRDDSEVGIAIELRQNYPNPFNPVTVIEYELGRAERVALTVFNARGEHVRVLAAGVEDAGQHKIIWDGRDDAGREVGAGIYFCKIETEHFQTVKKMVLVK
jgi:hypothetical protein